MQNFLALFLFFPGCSEREGGYCCNKGVSFHIRYKISNKSSHSPEQTCKNLTMFEVTVGGVRKEAMISVCHLCFLAALKCASHVCVALTNKIA